MTGCQDFLLNHFGHKKAQNLLKVLGF